MYAMVIYSLVFILFLGESRNVQVRIPGQRTYHLAEELTENGQYTFAVKARTEVDWGFPVTGHITIGPQIGIAYMCKYCPAFHIFYTCTYCIMLAIWNFL